MEGGLRRDPPMTIKEAPLNLSDLPNLRLVTCDASRREPGVMAFNVRPGGTDGGTAAGWIIGIDQEGEVALNLKFDAPTKDVRLHPNGNILFSQTGLGLITEIDVKLTSAFGYKRTLA